MIKEIVKAYMDNKVHIEDWVKSSIEKGFDYEDLIKKVLSYIVPDSDSFNSIKIYEVGIYQGTIVTLFKWKINLIIMVLDYGSCSGCDALEYAFQCIEDKDKQLSALMQITLNLVQSAKYLKY
jgi:hypothetical protein